MARASRQGTRTNQNGAHVLSVAIVARHPCLSGETRLLQTSQVEVPIARCFETALASCRSFPFCLAHVVVKGVSCRVMHPEVLLAGVAMRVRTTMRMMA